MRLNNWTGLLARLLVSTVATVLAAGCGSSSTAPSTNPNAAVSGVTLSATSVTVGGTVQATVSLKETMTTAVVIALASTNPAVATVPASVTVQPGASTATVAVTGVSAGATTIMATLNGTSGQSPAINVTALAALSSLTLSAATVVGGQAVTGTVVLSAPAPAGGASVVLTAGDPATVPPNVLVAAGSSRATFSVLTRTVAGTVSTTIGAAYGGVTMSATLSVTKTTVAIASFGVTGPTETDTCTLTNDGNTLNCTFNGSTSTAPGTINAWDWSFGVAKTYTQTTAGAILAMPTVSCDLIPPPPFPVGVQWFTMTVRLVVHDNQGNVSAEAVNAGVRVIPQNVCGF